MKMPCFLFKLRGSQKATQFYFRVSKRFFVSPMKLLPYFSLLSDCHSSLFCKESVILVFYSRLPQSYDQNTKLDKTLCSRVSSKNKENINLQSHISLYFFYLKNVLGAQIRRQKQNSRTAIFDVEREALQFFFNDTMGETESLLISLTPRDYQLQFIVSFLRPIKLSTLFSHELLAFISVCRHFWSHPNKGCLLLEGLPAKKLNL